MATETSVNTYTGIHGVVTYDSNPLAYVSMDVEFSRNGVEIGRGGKWGPIVLPGKAGFTAKLVYGLVDPDLFIAAFDDGTNTSSSSDEALHAAIAGTSAEQLINTALTNPSVAMNVKLKIISTDGYAAGSVIVNGTDSNDDIISEAIPFPLVATGSTTTYYYGTAKFKTITSIVIPAVLGTNDTVTPYGMGQRTITIGKPKYVTITAKAMISATQYVLITMNNCWLKGFPLSLGDADAAILPEQEIAVRDLDADVTITVNST